MLLRSIAAAGPSGARLSVLAKGADLPAPTVHRILARLVAEDLVAHRAGSRSYFLGNLVYELGLAAIPTYGPLPRLGSSTLRRIAEKTGDTVFLTVRSGLDSVCIDRKQGSYPIKALTLDIGTRRPLGVGAGGLALLQDLPDEKIDAILQANATRLKLTGQLTPPAVRKVIAHSRRRGFSLNERKVVPDVVSLGIPIRRVKGYPTAAISVGAVTSRMSSERQSEIARILKQEIKRLEDELRRTS